MTAELTMERTRATGVAGKQSASPIRNILLHIQRGDAMDRRLDTALSLARATSAHIHCVQEAAIEPYVVIQDWASVYFPAELMQQFRDDQARLRADMRQRLEVEDVSWDYAPDIAPDPLEIVRQAALADIVVTGRHRFSASAPGADLGSLGSLLTESRTPLLIPGDSRSFDPLGPVVIAWNGSVEAANAVRGALGLLKLASDVKVVRFVEVTDERFPSTTLLEYLSRHDIHADLQIRRPVQGDLVGELTDFATECRASTIVMGGYGHSRVGEFLFGGVTRGLLKACPMALLIAH